MSFKNFTEFNELSNQLPLARTENLSCADTQAANINRALAEVRQAAQAYASSYAKVAVWDYSNGGRPHDVTPNERQSVPENILARSRARLHAANNGYKAYLAAAKAPDDDVTADGNLRADLHDYTITVGGRYMILSPYRGSDGVIWDMDADSYEFIRTHVLASSISQGNLAYNFSSSEAAEFLAKRVTLPVKAVESDSHPTLMCYAFKLHQYTVILASEFNTRTTALYLFYQGNVAKYAMEWPAGEFGLRSSTLETGVFSGSTDNEMLTYAYNDFFNLSVEPSITDTFTIDVASSETTPTQILVVASSRTDRSVNESAAIANIASPEDLDAIEATLS